MRLKPHPFSIIYHEIYSHKNNRSSGHLKHLSESTEKFYVIRYLSDINIVPFSVHTHIDCVSDIEQFRKNLMLCLTPWHKNNKIFKKKTKKK